MNLDRVEHLRAEYHELHQRVLAAFRAGRNPDVGADQRREIEIRQELTHLGALPSIEASLLQ